MAYGQLLALLTDAPSELIAVTANAVDRHPALANVDARAPTVAMTDRERALAAVTTEALLERLRIRFPEAAAVMIADAAEARNG